MCNVYCIYIYIIYLIFSLVAINAKIWKRTNKCPYCNFGSLPKQTNSGQLGLKYRNFLLIWCIRNVVCKITVPLLELHFFRMEHAQIDYLVETQYTQSTRLCFVMAMSWGPRHITFTLSYQHWITGIMITTAKPVKKYIMKWVNILGFYSLRRRRLTGIGIPIMNLRRS